MGRVKLAKLDSAWWGILAGLILNFAAVSTPAAGKTTLYSDEEVPNRCQVAYDNGGKRFREAVEQNILIKGRSHVAAFFNAGMRRFATLGHECQHFFSMGVFDARGAFQQNVIMEYFLELSAARADSEPDRVVRAINDFYRERFRLAGLSAELVKRFYEDRKMRRDATIKFVDRMHALARKKDEAIPFGRFVFIEANPYRPLTLYEYERDRRGRIIEDGDGNPELRQGSYHRALKSIWSRAKQNTKEYLKWRPDLIWGEDSFLHGSLGRWWRGGPPEKSASGYWRWWWKGETKKHEKSPREIKEQHYMNTMTSLTNQARDFHMKLDPFFKLHRVMLRKQEAYLERDLDALAKIRVGVLAAPLIPVGMWLGASGAASAAAYWGYSATTGAAVANGTALGTMLLGAGFGTYGAVQDYLSARENNLPYKLSYAFEHVVTATVGSFPLAAALPAVVGGVPAAGKSVIVGTQRFIANGMNLAKTVRSLGFKGSLSKIPSLPGKFGRFWLHAWWERPWLAIRAVSASTATAVFEMGYRQLHMEGEDKFYHCADGEEGFDCLNKHALVTVGTVTLVAGVGTPFNLLKTLGGRIVTFQTLNFLASVSSQAILNGHVETDRTLFDLGAGFAMTPAGEKIRSIGFSSYMSRLGSGGLRGKAKQGILTLAMDIGVRFLATNPRVELLDRYVDDDKSALADIRAILLEELMFDLEGISDEELRAALDELTSSPRFDYDAYRRGEFDPIYGTE